MDTKTRNWNGFLVFLLVVVAFLLGVLANQITTLTFKKTSVVKDILAKNTNSIDLTKLQDRVLPPSKIYRFKITWGDLGKRMIEDGVIDEEKLTKAVVNKDKLPDTMGKYLDGSDQKMELSSANAHFWLDVLWGLGLANKNPLLDSGDMQKYGDPANFASTGEYTLGVSSAMDYYSKFSYLPLTIEQQKIVEEVARNIYRPCCGNSTAFPDCNHGMAMLGLIELMVSQNISKQEIYNTALVFNTLWFPETYLDIAYHFEKAGRDYQRIPAQEILAKTFSSAQGYAVIRKEVGQLAWPTLGDGGGCSV